MSLPTTAEALAAWLRVFGLHDHYYPHPSRASGGQWWAVEGHKKSPLCATERCLKMQFKQIKEA